MYECPNCGEPMTVVEPQNLAVKRVDISKLPLEPPKPTKCLVCDYMQDAVTYPQDT